MNKPETLADSRLFSLIPPVGDQGLQPRYAENAVELEILLNRTIATVVANFPEATVVGLSVSGGGDPTDFIGFVSFGIARTGEEFATGTVVVGGGGAVVEGMTFVLDDGINPAVTFEFDSNGSVIPTPTLRPVVYTALDTDAQLAAAVVLAVNGAPLLGITAGVPFGGGPTTVPLTNDVIGAAGNVAITTAGFPGAPFAVTGMAGGADGVADPATEIPVAFARVFCEDSAVSDQALAEAASRIWNRIAAIEPLSEIYQVQVAAGGAAPKFLIAVLAYLPPPQ